MRKAERRPFRDALPLRMPFMRFGVIADNESRPIYNHALPNQALVRSVKGCGWRPGGARRNFAHAARWNRLARPAQCER
jgi:hypothetical protein